MRNALRTASCLSLLVVAVRCGGGGAPPPAGQPASKVVSSQGGELASTDGKLEVAVPAGALRGDLTITVEAAEPPSSGAISTVYEIGPTGTQFEMPVTLKLRYDLADLAGTPESSLRVATFAGGSWQILPGAVVDTQNKTVSGLTTHLSPYAVVAEASGRTCATVQSGLECSAPNTSAGGGSSSAPTCTAPTCAEATDVCRAFPGATRDSCMDGDKGYSASCCFPSGGPICFAVAGGAAPCSGTTGGGGSSCAAAPTCAGSAATACAAYPGATLQGCTDGATGYAGGCCFAPQAPVCVAVSEARLCSGTTSPSGGGSAGCSPPPRCADGNPCARYAGGMASSCTDTANGFTATCCFAVGSLPIVVSGPSAGGSDVDGGAPAADGGVPIGTPGTGGSSGTGGTAGGTAGVTGTGGTAGSGPLQQCVPDATCAPGSRCANGSLDSCMECTCLADGHLKCAPCPIDPGTGTGGTAGGTAGITGTGGTAGSSPQQCMEGATCAPGSRCGNGSPDSCMECTCLADGHLKCAPCPIDPGTGTGGTAGGTGGTTSGTAGVTGTGGTAGSAQQCLPGATCEPGFRCGSGGETCMECTCETDGHLKCGPCMSGPGTGGTTAGAGGTAGGTAGVTGTGGTAGSAQQCMPGATCEPGFRCGSGGETCMECLCEPDGHLKCEPCPGGTGGTATGGGGSTGSATGPCSVMPMPWPGGDAPCGVREICPDGNDYRVTCDGATSTCTCLMKGIPTAQTPTLSCATLDPIPWLVACGFPDGKI